MAVGVYCLGNDRVHDWLVSLFASLRLCSPKLPVTLIPFDGNLARTRSLCAQYSIAVAEPEFDELDGLSRRLWPDLPVGFLRKLAAFWGVYESFMYLDADTLILEPLETLLMAASANARRVLYLEGNLNEVYRPGWLRADFVADRSARRVNTGVFAGSHGLVSFADADHAASGFVEQRDHMTDVYEMSFVNYLLDTLGVRCVAFSDLVPNVGAGWAGLRLRRRDGHWTQAQQATQTPTGRIVVIHWAGFPLTPWMPYYRSGSAIEPELNRSSQHRGFSEGTVAGELGAQRALSSAACLSSRRIARRASRSGDRHAGASPREGVCRCSLWRARQAAAARCSSRTSAGVRQPSVLRGRLLSASATAARSSAL
jgi:hypothetical protein